MNVILHICRHAAAIGVFRYKDRILLTAQQHCQRVLGAACMLTDYGHVGPAPYARAAQALWPSLVAPVELKLDLSVGHDCNVVVGQVRWQSAREIQLCFTVRCNL